MISFNSFINKALLTEAYDYKQIFVKVLQLSDGHYGANETYKKTFERGQAVLKKNFRIIWYNKLVQLYIASIIRWERDEAAKYYDKLLNSECKKYNLTSDRLDEKIRKDFLPVKTLTEYEHFLDLHLKEIDDYNPTGKFPEEVFKDLKEIENEWAAELDGTVQYSKQPLLSEDEENKEGCIPVIDYKDGWYWVDLQTNYCEKESRAMGHCGSASRGSTLLSLRYLNKRKPDPSTWLWEPHITCELEPTGIMTQRKGKQNTKPVEKYHKYMLDLLLHKVTTSSKGTQSYLIKGLMNAYDPDSDFQIADLTPEERETLFEQRPELMTVSEMYKKVGKTPELIEKVTSTWNSLNQSRQNNYNLIWNENQKDAVIYVAPDIHDFIGDYGTSGARRVLEVDQDGFNYNDPYEGNIEDCFDMLDSSKVTAYLEENYPDDEEAWDGDEFKFLKDNNDDIYEQCRYAAERGEQDGISQEMMKSLYDALDSILIKDYNSDDILYGAYITKENVWSEPLKVWLPFDKVLQCLEYMENTEDWENYSFYVDVEEPYNGWSDYSTKGAKDYMKDESGFGNMMR